MPVKVYAAKTPEEWTHANGVGLNISDGHLIVVDNTSRTPEPQHQIAVYTPGLWERAEVTQ